MALKSNVSVSVSALDLDFNYQYCMLKLTKTSFIETQAVRPGWISATETVRH